MADWDARTYDRIADPLTAMGARVVERLELRGDELVMDAGCGTGRVTELLAERLTGLGPGRVVGVDRSPAMVAEAARRLARFGDRVELIVADLADPLPLEPVVDLVVSTATFHWIADHQGLFANLFQVLRPGGRLVAQFGGEGNLAGVDRVLAELGRGGRSPHYESVADTSERLAKAGFAEVEAGLEAIGVGFDTRADLETYLRTIILREVVLGVPEPERPALVAAVAERLPGGRIDYVRLNVSARRPAA